jgi:hypothetical protein
MKANLKMGGCMGRDVLQIRMGIRNTESGTKERRPKRVNKIKLKHDKNIKSILDYLFPKYNFRFL